MASIHGRVRKSAAAAALKIRTGSVAQHFKRLSSRWKAATQYTSSPVQMAMHPAYQQITGLGPEAVPLLLRELEREPEH